MTDSEGKTLRGSVNHAHAMEGVRGNSVHQLLHGLATIFRSQDVLTILLQTISCSREYLEAKLFSISILIHIKISSTMAFKQWNGKPLSLKVIGTNAGTSMDGLDIAHVHYTQANPAAPLKMRLLRAGEVEFDGALKSKC